MQGQKHLIKCRCILSQFKRDKDPVNHHFIVFSVLDENNNVIPKYAQCNNCGIIHKVIDICRSEIIVGRENMPTIISINDIKASLQDNIVSILDLNKSDLPTWEMVNFIIENKQWGNIVVLSSDSDDDLRQGKYIRILGENLAKVESFVREEIVK